MMTGRFEIDPWERILDIVVFHSTELYNSLGFFLSRCYLVMSISRQRNNS